MSFLSSCQQKLRLNLLHMVHNDIVIIKSMYLNICRINTSKKGIEHSPIFHLSRLNFLSPMNTIEINLWPRKKKKIPQRYNTKYINTSYFNNTVCFDCINTLNYKIKSDLLTRCRVLRCFQPPRVLR